VSLLLARIGGAGTIKSVSADSTADATTAAIVNRIRQRSASSTADSTTTEAHQRIRVRSSDSTASSSTTEIHARTRQRAATSDASATTTATPLAFQPSSAKRTAEARAVVQIDQTIIASASESTKAARLLSEIASSITVELATTKLAGAVAAPSSTTGVS
jgi:hypothetical protein